MATTRRVSLLSGDQKSSLEDASIVGFDVFRVETGTAGSFVFIDRGSSDGVTVGQLLDIYQLPAKFAVDELDEDIEGIRFHVGEVRIIDTTDVGAVGYVMYSKSEIRLGDRVGKG